tara:strand:+ start:85 stop:459 length:375 start_codon:yes stop_codon:yes gene_type:complete
MSIPICDFEEGVWGKFENNKSEFIDEGIDGGKCSFHVDKDRNPILEWNKKKYDLDAEWHIDGLLKKFKCLGKREYEFDLDSEENIHKEDFIYIKDLCGKIYYLKMSKSSLKGLKQLLCARTCEK